MSSPSLHGPHVHLRRVHLEEDPYEPLRVDPAIEAQQAERLAKLRAGRDQAAVDSALAALRKAAESDADTANVL